MICRCTIFHGNLSKADEDTIREPDSVGNFGYGAVSKVYVLLFWL
jgi:hypothetical protein